MWDALRKMLSPRPAAIRTCDPVPCEFAPATISDDLALRPTICSVAVPRFPPLSITKAIDPRFAPVLVALIPLARFGGLLDAPNRVVIEAAPAVEESALSISDFFGTGPEPAPPARPERCSPPPAVAPPLRDFLLEELADELGAFKGQDTLRRLFWNLLAYERVDRPLPEEFFPSAVARWLLSATLFAQYEELPILLVRAREGRFHETVRRAVLERAASRWGQAVVLFCDSGWKKIALGFHSIAEGDGGAFIRLAPLPTTPDRQARRLASLRTHTREDVPRGLLGLCESYSRLVAEQREAKEDREAFREPPVDPDGLYYRDLSRHARVSEEETRALLVRLADIPEEDRKTTRRDESEHIRNRVMLGYWHLCEYIIKLYRFQKSCQSFSKNDLMQEGMIGLIKAVDSFDAKRDTTFSTCAGMCIRQAISRKIQSADRTIRLAANCYSKKNWISVEEAQRLRWLLSLSHHRFDDSLLFVEATPDEIALAREIEANRLFLIEQAMQRLSPRERAILEARFGFAGNRAISLPKIGKRIGLDKAIGI